MLTYGDGVCDVNIRELLGFHKKENKMVTITAVRPNNRFGALTIGDGNKVSGFAEKRHGDGGWINGGYMILEPEIFRHIGNDETILEREPLEYAVDRGEMVAYPHSGFWACMDTMRDKQYLENLLRSHTAPWEVWEND
jgi:glucose-1-phosphate cytidylyltransferase